MKQSFFKKLAKQGAHFSHFMALTHPSQGNYVALTSGSLQNVRNDRVYDINAKNIVDLLEAHSISWKIYAEGYPGNCFTGKKYGHYVRKHNPFISYVNIQRNKQTCSHIVDEKQFDRDVVNNSLPQYIFYVPNMDNDGHDTGVSYASRWYEKRFTPILENREVMTNTILISTFDESGRHSSKNQIYTTISGPGVKVGVYDQQVNLVSLLRLIEDNWSLGDLNQQDVDVEVIPSIWK